LEIATRLPGRKFAALEKEVRWTEKRPFQVADYSVLGEDSRVMNGGRISRRTMLRGVGATMALPWLDAMAPSKAAAAETAAGPAVRFAALYMANGAYMPDWKPKGEGAGFDLSKTLSPLASHKNDVLVLSGLWHKAADTGDGHYVKTGSWLTGTTITRTTGSEICSGNTSLDQVMAQHVGNLTPLPSLELGTEPTSTGVDTNVGFTQLYGAHIAWSSPTTPLAKEINPKLAYDRIFRAGGSSSALDDTSVLDLVADDARRLQRHLGAADRLKLEQYFESVRSVEKRIEFDRRRKRSENMEDALVRAEVARLGAAVDLYNDPARVSERHDNHSEQVRLMLDIMALAFWTDSTRVATFMFGNSVSGRNFSFLEPGLGSHHENSHHENKRDKFTRYQKINQWHVAQYAYFLDRLREYKDGSKSVLDNSMVLFGAGMSDGNQHSPHDLPLVLAGRGGGSLSPGKHLAFEKDHPACNLHLALLHRMGVKADRFADSTGELAGLT
jgi:Protein of unknown function (DUF1552)